MADLIINSIGLFEKFEGWFNKKFGWFFTNGRKKQYGKKNWYLKA